MIDMKRAVEVAKTKAIEMLGEGPLNLEEIEREWYKDHDVWSITLSLPRQQGTALMHLAHPVQYKRFLIDSDTGELIAMKVREIASR